MNPTLGQVMERLWNYPLWLVLAAGWTVLALGAVLVGVLVHVLLRSEIPPLECPAREGVGD